MILLIQIDFVMGDGFHYLPLHDVGSVKQQLSSTRRKLANDHIATDLFDGDFC